MKVCGCFSIVPVDGPNVNLQAEKQRFTAGKKHANVCLKLRATFTDNSQTVTVKKYRRKTNDKGEFCIPILADQVSLTLKGCYDRRIHADKQHLTGTYDGGQYYMRDLVWRTYDGDANNLEHPNWGATDTALLRQSGTAYGDGVSTLAVRGPNNPNPRAVSNAICKKTEDRTHPTLTNMMWLWGQFVDHEIDLTNTGSEVANMTTPNDDQYPGLTIPFNRSNVVFGSSPRQQPNHISAYIDGTNVYGYRSQRAHHLRMLDGSGKLKTSIADNGEVVLPFNTFNEDNAMGNGSNFYLAGDVRANENVFLTGMHTLFVREHNRQCDIILARNPNWAGLDELIYQRARSMICGYMCQITYGEFLPALLQPGAIPPYSGYKPEVNASIKTEFSTVAYRLGHSMIAEVEQLRGGGTLAIKDAFFNPAYVTQNGVDDALVGTVLGNMQQIDEQIVDALRDFLFGPPSNTMMLDLASLNIQRGRDHGIPGYNAVRVAYGLSAHNTFADVTSKPELQTKLATLYVHPDHIDPWVGGLCEDHLPNAELGELFHTILVDQFTRLRDGDYFWFERDPALTDAEKDEIRNTTLGDIMRRNISNGQSIPRDAFHSA